MDNRKILEKLGIDLSPANKDARGFFKGFITEYTKNVKKFNSEDVQEYFNTFIAAMMLEYHKLYENFDIQVPYRIKSPKSVLDKVLEYLSRDEKSTYSFNSENEYQGRLNEDLKDMFAITIVACNRPPTFYSRDPEINELIEEKKRNHALLGEVQRFKLRITNDEFAGKEKNSYNFNCSKEEYYLNCIMIVKRIKSLINPNATNLLKKYDNILEDIESIVPEYFFDICDTIISESNKSKDLDNSDKIRMEYNKIYKLIRESDMSEQDKIRLIKDITIDDVEKVDFLSLVDDFTARIHDKLDLAILTKQVHSVFDKSELLSKFEIKIDKEDGKRKRTENGYVSNFIYLQTPFGKVEMQIQTQHENKEGNYGYAAHNCMFGKGFREFDLPDSNNPEEMREFRTCVSFISPKKFLAQFDNAEPNRILTQVFGDYQNYKSIMSQVKKGSEDDLRLKKYFGQLYAKRSEIFPNEDKDEKIESFIEYDIEEYLESEKFKHIIKKYANVQENKRQDDDKIM